MNLSKEFRDVIKQDCVSRKHEEACGLIIKDFNDNINIVPCPNSSTTPKKSFIIEENIVDKYARKNQIIGYYHSHIHKNANELSWIDKAMSEQTNMICVMYDIYSGNFHIHKPCGWTAPLLKRPYMIGFFDSFTIVKDFYKKSIDIKNNFHYHRYTKGINTLTRFSEYALHRVLCKNNFYLIPFLKEKCAVILNIDNLDKEFGVFVGGKIITQFENHFSEEYDMRDIYDLDYTVRCYSHDKIN